VVRQMIQLLKLLIQGMWAELKSRQHISPFPRTTDLSVFGAGFRNPLLRFRPQNILLLLLHFPPPVFWLVLFFVLNVSLCFLAERFMVAPLLYEVWAFPFRLAFCRSHSLPSHLTNSSFHKSISLCIAIETIWLFAVYTSAHDNRFSQRTHTHTLTQPHTVRL
jgi:hypothetical protein